MSKAVIRLDNVRFAWSKQAEPLLDIAALQIDAGESLFLHGPSGCGKSTLLSLMAGVLTTSSGSVTVCGKDWRTLGEAARDRHRADHVGYIFQQFNLLPYLSVLDNVLLPCRFSALRRTHAERDSGDMQHDAKRWLRGMGLPESMWQRAARELSVGQQQRVAAARALIGKPALVIADEPTSALDEGRQNSFLDLLQQACHAADSALILVSHDQRIASRFDRNASLTELNRAYVPAADTAQA